MAKVSDTCILPVIFDGEHPIATVKWTENAKEQAEIACLFSASPDLLRAALRVANCLNAQDKCPIPTEAYSDLVNAINKSFMRNF